MKKTTSIIYCKLLILIEVKFFLENNRHKKNVDSGSTFKTFVDSLPRVKNTADVINKINGINKTGGLLTIDEKITHCQSQIASTEVWKKGLLQQMFC